MTLPQQFWRYPTAEAIANLAVRFNVPNHPEMQDWEWEVADSSRLDEYLAVYNSGELTDDERFTLMETIIQAFENAPGELDAHPHWGATLSILGVNFDLHAYTVWYWSGQGHVRGEGEWRVSQPLRSILEMQMPRLSQ